MRLCACVRVNVCVLPVCVCVCVCALPVCVPEVIPQVVSTLFA